MNLLNSNIIVLANSFNTTLFNTHWLAKKNILSDSEAECVSMVGAPGFAQIEDEAFNLLVLPERIQFTFKKAEESLRQLEKIRLIVKYLPETPYSAVGINFSWAFSPESTTVSQFTRKAFANPQNSFFEYFFSDPNSRYGTYVSKDFELFRMKVDVKPVKNVASAEEAIVIGINFHYDVAGSEKVSEVLSAIELWSKVNEEASKIAQKITS